MMERNKEKKLSEQMKEKAGKEQPVQKEYDGDFGTVISTGSTLLDLAISGGRIRGGGLPGGVFVEIFGPAGAGKTVLLAEIAGDIQRKGGDALFADPEARLNKQFAAMFGVNFDAATYIRPDTVNGLFDAVQEWEPKEVKGKKLVHGVLADSLAALSTELEMGDKGDAMGMKRAKDFSVQLRMICRVLADNNYLMVCSNQVRENVDGVKFGEKIKTTGGYAVGFYASLRLRVFKPEKIKLKKRMLGKDVTRIIGVESVIEVYKSSIWKPYHQAPIYILFDYGIDDIRGNLQYIKDNTKNTMYMVNETKLNIGIEESIVMVEELGLVDELKEQVIDLWEDIESRFEQERKPKQR